VPNRSGRSISRRAGARLSQRMRRAIRHRLHANKLHQKAGPCLVPEVIGTDPVAALGRAPAAAAASSISQRRTAWAKSRRLRASSSSAKARAAASGAAARKAARWAATSAASSSSTAGCSWQKRANQRTATRPYRCGSRSRTSRQSARASTSVSCGRSVAAAQAGRRCGARARAGRSRTDGPRSSRTHVLTNPPELFRGASRGHARFGLW
jgi:hypothetical protein